MAGRKMIRRGRQQLRLPRLAASGFTVEDGEKGKEVPSSELHPLQDRHDDAVEVRRPGKVNQLVHLCLLPPSARWIRGGAQFDDARCKIVATTGLCGGAFFAGEPLHLASP
jgi:hypothetical protein